MATPTPRKFQEKIAQLNERAMQSTTDFNNVMKEVSSLRTQGVMNELNYSRQKYEQKTSQHCQHRPQQTVLHAMPIHLSPPEQLIRSSSDSSLHQTAYQRSAPEERRNVHGEQYDIHKQDSSPLSITNRDLYGSQTKNASIPVPTISNLSGPNAGAVGGGSLPDLTQVQFMQPVGIPLMDADGAVDYKTAPQVLHQLGNFPPNGPYYRPRGSSPGPSSRLSPVFDRKQKPKPYSHPPSSSQRSCKGIITDNSSRIQPIDTHLANSGLSILTGPISPVGSHPTSPTGITNYRTSSPDPRNSPPSPLNQASPLCSPLAAKNFTYESFPTPGTHQLNHRFQQITVIDNQSGNVNFNPTLISSGNQMDNQSGNAVFSPTMISSGNQIEPHVDCPTYYQSSASTPVGGSLPVYPLSPTGSSSPNLENRIPHPPSPSQASPSHSPISPGIVAPVQPTTPQTPLTPSVALPRVVLTDQDGNDGRELLMSDMTEIQEDAFLFDEFILKNFGSLDEDTLMGVDQIMVDNEIEEGFRRDLRNTDLTQVLPNPSQPVQVTSVSADSTQQSSPQEGSPNAISTSDYTTLTNVDTLSSDPSINALSSNPSSEELLSLDRSSLIDNNQVISPICTYSAREWQELS